MQMTLIAHDQTTTVVHPAKTALHFPTLAIACSGADRTPAFGLLPLAPFIGRDGRLDPASPQLAAEIRTVIGFVRDQFFRSGLSTTAAVKRTNGFGGGDNDRLWRGPGGVAAKRTRRE